MKKKQQVEIVANVEEMQRFGSHLAKELSAGSIVALYGNLGAGKTTLAKGIIEKLTLTPKREIASPTFTYLNIYGSAPLVYHFDLYRLKDESAFVQMGFLDHLEDEGICLIEWAERIDSLLPPQTLHIKLHQIGEKKREIHVCES